MTESEPQERKKTQVEILLDLSKNFELFHTPEKRAFATLNFKTHSVTWPVPGEDIGHWLTTMFLRECGTAPHPQSLKSVTMTLQAKGLLVGEEHPVFVRVARTADRVYLDLADDSYRVVEIRPDGWEVSAKSPVRFRRTRGMMPLPEPISGGSVDELRPLLNLHNDEQFHLTIGWIVGALRGVGPFPVAEVVGEQGTGKSNLSRMMIRTIDPQKPELRAAPGDERDLVIAAANRWCLGFDNLSVISPSLSDSFCRMSTGGGVGTRTLFTNEEETLFDSMRPVLVNGIRELVTKSDLLERTLIVTPPLITKRMQEKTINARFKAIHPSVLGALLDATACGLAGEGKAVSGDLPRMADFAAWMMAAEKGLGWKPGTFMAALKGNKRSANARALEAEDLWVAIKTFLHEHSVFEGTATKLLRDMEAAFEPQWEMRRRVPKGASALAGLLRELAPNMREIGYTVDFDREGHAGARIIRLAIPVVSGVSAVSASDQAA